MVLPLDIQIFQRNCDGQSRGDQEDQFEKDREGIQTEYTAVRRKLDTAQPEQEKPRNRDTGKRDESQRALVFDEQIKNEQGHAENGKLQLRNNRPDILHLKKLRHQRRSPVCWARRGVAWKKSGRTLATILLTG